MANCVQCGRKLPPFSFGKKVCQWCVQHEAAQRGELGEEAKQRVMPAPWIQREGSITLTRVIFGINVAVFLGMVFAAGSVAGFSGQDAVNWGANWGPLTLSGQWWRLLTYMFVHGNLMHIAFNMWCLWDLGALCESLYGRWTFGAVYLITGVGAGLASVGWNPGVLSVGASGAIFGLAGALISSFYLGEFSMPRFALAGTLRSLVFFAGFSLFFGFVGNWFVGIDNAAHIAGLVTGLVLGALIARIAPEPDRPLRRAGVLLFVALLVGGSALGMQRWRSPYLRGLGIYPQDNSGRMIAALQKKVRQSPQDASAHYALAHAYFASGQFPEGEGELKRVLELQPANSEARMDLGAAYLNREQPKEAQDEFTKLVTQEPSNARAHMGLAMALADQQNHQAALEEYKTALRLDPQSNGVYYKMGISQAQLKQYDDAITSYLKEREKSGDDAGLEIALADAYQAKGMQQEAREARDKATQLRSQQIN
jgi:membrane associated rhomboid family serine protease/Flp pilus assembly protein TadD